MIKHYNIAIINVGQKNNNIIIYWLKKTTLQIKFSRWFEFNYKIINYYIAAEKWTQFRELYPQENSHFYYFLWAIFHFLEIKFYWKKKKNWFKLNTVIQPSRQNGPAQLPRRAPAAPLRPQPGPRPAKWPARAPA